MNKELTNNELYEKLGKNFYYLGMFEGIKLILLIAIAIKVYLS